MKKTLLLIAALSFAARAVEPDADDPIGRMQAERALDDGVRTPEAQKAILEAAASEALRYGIGRSGRSTAAAVAGSVWVNIGPTTADFEKNGSTYFKVDSGRARKIIVDPTDANVVYFATSGGGVWKTRNALAAVTATSGPSWTPITEGLLTLSIGSLAMNPGNHNSLVLGLGDPFDVQSPGFSIVTSDDGGRTWSGALALIGSYGGGVGTYTASSVRDLAFDPGGQVVLAATNAGLFIHSNGGVGAGWTLQDVSPTHQQQDCWSIAYAGTTSWVVSCIDPTSLGHLWRTTSGGSSWTEVTSGFDGATVESNDVDRITLASAPQNAGQPWRVYALAGNNNNNQPDQKDVFRSDDGGATWMSLNMHGCVYSAAGSCSPGEAPANPTDDQPDLDFIHDQASYNQMLVVDPGNSQTVFIGGNLSMARSTDAGLTWKVMTDWLPFSLTTNTGGLDTANNSQYAHADWHTATVARVGGVAWFYGGNDGGLIRGSNASGSSFLVDPPPSVTWEDRLNRGIVSHLVYSVASGKERPSTSCTGGGIDIIWGGLQDDGTRLRTLPGNCTAGTTAPTCTNYVGYSQVTGGDGFGVGLGCSCGSASCVSPTPGAMGSHLISTYVMRISTSDDGGATFTKRVDQPTSNGLATGLSNPQITLSRNFDFKMKVVTDLTRDFTYLTPVSDSSGQGYVYRSTDNGATWNGINGTIHTAAATTITVWPKPMRNVTAHLTAANHYAAVDGGRVYVTTDGGLNWYESNRAVPGVGTAYLSLSSVAFDPNDGTGGTVWAGASATVLSDGSPVPAGTGHLFKCTGIAGVAGGACTAMSSGIPAAVPVNAVKVDPGTSGAGTAIYVGTEIGLYRSTDGGASFTRYGTGLPLVSVTDIAINADDSAVRVSTFGRGFWEIYPSSSAVGVGGNGDLDNSGVIDGFDLVREAAIMFSDRTSPDFNAAGDLVFNNVIDNADIAALVAKLGGFP